MRHTHHGEASCASSLTMRRAPQFGFMPHLKVFEALRLCPRAPFSDGSGVLVLCFIFLHSLLPKYLFYPFSLYSVHMAAYICIICFLMFVFISLSLSRSGCGSKRFFGIRNITWKFTVAKEF